MAILSGFVDLSDYGVGDAKGAYLLSYPNDLRNEYSESWVNSMRLKFCSASTYSSEEATTRPKPGHCRR